MTWRLTPLLLVACVLAPLCLAQPENASALPQVAAARSDALENLRQQILAAHVLPDTTAQVLIDKSGGMGMLDNALNAARQVGGPRWIDEQTAQVRLEIDGGPVADALVQMLQGHPKALPIPPQALRDRLKRWKRRTFSAIGTSTAPSAVDRLRPDPTQLSWQSVNDQDRRRAIEAARQHAAQRVIDSLLPITWDGNRKLGDLLAVPAVRGPVQSWLDGRPVTSIEFRDNLEVRLTLSAPPADFWAVLRDAMERERKQPLPTGPADWEQLRQQVEGRMAVATGSAVAAPGAGGPRRSGVAIPAEKPRWADDAMDARATASSPGGPLRAARAAKALASQQLRTKVNALTLTPGVTLGDAARQDPRIEEALARGIERAQISRVEYDAPRRGDVTTRLTLNLEDVWRELSLLSQ
jgi:hypothetical protein